MKALILISLFERKIFEIDTFRTVRIDEVVQGLDSVTFRGRVEKWDETSGVDETEDPEGEESDIVVDSGLQLEDGSVRKQVSDLLRDVGRVIKNDDFAGWVADNEDRPTFLTLLRPFGENELTISLGVEREEVVLVD